MYDNIIKIYELEHIRNKIKKIESTSKDNHLIIHITLVDERNDCPYCSFKKSNINDYIVKKITHTISNTKKIYIHYNQRRYKCSLCDKTFFEHNPFITTNSNISTLTIMNILEYLKDPNHTFTSAGNQFNVSTMSVINIFDTYVKPRRIKLPEVLCIDEIHIKTGAKYPYACVLLDFETNKIVDVLKTRRKKHLKDYFRNIKSNELETVEYVVMDLWSPYKDIVIEFLPNAKIVADAFHVVSHINKILDKKRISVMNFYLKHEGVDLYYGNDFGYLLKKFSWMIRVNPSKIKATYYYIKKCRFRVYKTELLNHLLSADEELKEIYELRSIYMNLNEFKNPKEATLKLKELTENFMNHHIEEIREYGHMLFRWQDEIINSFYKHNGVRYSNAKLESRNRQIKTIIRNAFGYKNFNRFRARVMYSINQDIPLKI